MDMSAAMQLVGRDIYDVITNYGYTVFPLFILMGQIGFNAGIAVRLYDAAHKFIGHIPGGLAMATVMGATGFKAICGSSAATSAPLPALLSQRWTVSAIAEGCQQGLLQRWEPLAASYHRALSSSFLALSRNNQ